MLHVVCESCLLCCAGKVTNKADIYSFGVVIWEICTLERPAWRGMLRDIRCALLVPLQHTLHMYPL